MKKSFPLVLASSALFWGCFESSTNPDSSNTGAVASQSSSSEVSSNETSAVAVDTVSSLNDMKACLRKNDGSLSLVSGDDVMYKCIDGRWVSMGSYVVSAEDMKNCVADRRGDVFYVVDEGVSYSCDGERWRYYEQEDETPEDGTQEDAAPAGNSSNSNGAEESTSESSSSLLSQLSSSSVASSSSSVAGASKDTSPKLVNWEGFKGDYRVLTALDNGSNTSGYWYVFNDKDDGGTSSIVWPVQLGNDYDAQALDPVIDQCGGVCGTVQLEKDSMTYNPFVGVGFNLAGEGKSGAVEAADASAWGGVCITYTSDVTASLEMGLDSTLEENLGYDVPFVSLPKASSAIERCYPWSKFKQAGWGKVKTTGDESAKSMTTLKFKVQAADGTTGKFNIMAISSYFGESQSVIPVQSSSSVVRSSSSMAIGFAGETWNGWEGVYQVETGLDEGYEDSGYWLIFDDSEDGGKSFIQWPAELGNGYYESALDNVIDECSGVCGTYNLDKGDLDFNPYVGVYFLMGGTIEGKEPVAVDASQWGGVCVAYSSDMSILLEMGLDEALEDSLGMDVPVAVLSKSASGARKCIPWSSFKQQGWGKAKITSEEAVTKMVSLRFRFQGTDGSVGKFNISSVGSYH